LAKGAACFFNLQLSIGHYPHEELNDFNYPALKKWQIPVNWRKLNKGLTKQEVEQLLSVPDVNENTCWKYGNGGEIYFEYGAEKDFILKYWNEPFWPDLYKEFSKDESDAVGRYSPMP